MKNYLKKLDFLSSKISLYNDRQPRHQNFIGGILFTLVILFSIAISGYFFYEFIAKINPKAYLINKYLDDVGIISANKTQLFNTININIPKKGPIPFNKRALTPTTIIQVNNGSIIATYYYDYCKYDEDMMGLEDYFDISLKDVIETTHLCKSYLIDSNGKKIMKSQENFYHPFMAHGMSSQTMNSISFVTYIKRCTNSSENNFTCLPDEEIDNYYNNLLVTFKFIDNYVDITNYTNPVTRFMNKVEGMINSANIDINYLTFKSIKIYTHNGILFDNIEMIETYKYDYRVESIVNRKATEKNAFQVSCSLQNMAEVYDRSYIRLQDVAANIGGIVKFVYLIAACFNYFSDELKIIQNYSDNLKEKIFVQADQNKNPISVEIYNSENWESKVKVTRSRQNMKNKIELQKIEINENLFSYMRKKFCFWKRFNLKDSENFKKMLNLRYFFLDEKNLINLHLHMYQIKKLILREPKNLSEILYSDILGNND